MNCVLKIHLHEMSAIRDNLVSDNIGLICQQQMRPPHSPTTAAKKFVESCFSATKVKHGVVSLQKLLQTDSRDDSSLSQPEPKPSSGIKTLI